jgi:hypothetical protein
MFTVKERSIGFARKEFKNGQNFTVRLGADWVKGRDIKVGDHITMASQDREVLYFIGKITHIIICDLINIPKNVIQANHQADMRDGIGLVLGLQNYYKQTLIASDRVTCIGFVPVIDGSEKIPAARPQYGQRSGIVLSEHAITAPVDPSAGYIN